MIVVDGIASIVKIKTDFQSLSNEKDYVEENKKVKSAAASDKESTKDLDQQQTLNEEQVQQAVDKINKTMETYNTELRFQLHEKSGEYIVKIISTKDKKVIREVPPEKVLNMVAYFKELLGLIVDKFA